MPITADDVTTTSASWSNAFKRKKFWRTVWEFGLVLSLFLSLGYKFLTDIKLRLDRIETHLMTFAAKPDESVLGSLFLCYHESRCNIDFRRNLYW